MLALGPGKFYKGEVKKKHISRGWTIEEQTAQQSKVKKA